MPYPWEAPSDSCVGENGWIDADAMSRKVHDALARSVGNVLPAGEGSHAVARFKDKDTAGRAVTFAEGEWATGFADTTRKMRACLEALGVDPLSAAQRALRVRYRTERRSGVARPGKLRLLITVTVRAGSSSRIRTVHPPRQVLCLIKDFQERF